MIRTPPTDPNQSVQVTGRDLNLITVRPWRELSVLALISMEVSWVFAWYTFLAGDQVDIKFPWRYIYLFLTMTGAYLLARIAFLVRLRVKYRRAFLLLAYAISTGLLIQGLQPPGAASSLRLIVLHMKESFHDTRNMFPVEMVQVTLSTYLWYRALSFAQSRIDPKIALGNFSLGAAMLLLIGFTVAFKGGGSPSVQLAIFGVSALLSLGTARISSLHRLRGGHRVSFSKPWIMAVLFASLLITLLALSLGHLAAGGIASFVSFLFQWLIRLVLLIAVILVSPIILLAFLVGSWLENVSLFTDVGRELSKFIELMIGLLVDIEQSLQGRFSLQVDLWVWKPRVLSCIIIALLGLAFWWLGRQWRLPWSVTNEGYDEHDQAEGWKARRVSLLLKQGLQQVASQVRSMLPRRGLLGALRIRRLYTRLIRLCGELGFPRSTAETPLEFLPTLWQLFPRSREDARLMTEAYNRVRYGERPETRSEVELVEQAWSRIKGEAGLLRQAQRQMKAR